MTDKTEPKTDTATGAQTRTAAPHPEAPLAAPAKDTTPPAAAPQRTAASQQTAADKPAAAAASAKAAPSPVAAQPEAPTTWSAKRPLVVGFIGVFILVVVLGGWSTQTSIAGAVVTSGLIEVEANRQVVNHPDGGVVGDILVKEGDRVEAGEVLIRFDDTLLRNELNIVEGQLFEVMARADRLKAERDDAEAIEWGQDILAEQDSYPEVQELMDGQRDLFVARRDSLRQEIGQLRQRQTQIRDQIRGAEAQLEALDEQQDLIAQELADAQSLLERGLIEASRVLALQREDARLRGQLGELTAAVAQSEGQITETDIQILRLEATRREEAISTLRDLQYTEIELKQQRLSLTERLNRMEVRAPMTGLIYGQEVFAVRATVRPAEPMMFIVPQDSDLVITARVRAIDRDAVSVGQPATLNFSAFNTRTTPQLFGTVTRVSADAFVDETTGQSFFEAELLPNEGEIEKLIDQGLEVLPGMPVDAFISTAEQSPMTYILKPFLDYLAPAMRDTHG